MKRSRKKLPRKGKFWIGYSPVTQSYFFLYGKNAATASVLSRHATRGEALAEWDRVMGGER